MNTIKLLTVCLLLCVAPGGAFAAPPSADKLSVLVVDGVNNHDWPRATPIIKDILLNSGLCTVDVSTSPAGDAPSHAWNQWRPDFSKYDVVLSNFNGGHTASGIRWPKPVERALEEYVRGGGGLVVFHSANNSFPDWRAYNEMIGLGWRNKDFGPTLVVDEKENVVRIAKGLGSSSGHGPDHDFQVTVLDSGHPITKGIPKRWMHPREQLSHGQRGPAKNLTVLSYAWSKDSKANEPIDWVVRFGKGRVYTTTLGHLGKGGSDVNLRSIGLQTMLIRGTQWAAGGEATYPLPDDFPGENTFSIGKEFGPSPFKITTKNAADRVVASIDGDTALFWITSPRGIGRATIERVGRQWPKRVSVRMYLRGLEGFRARGGGETTLEASVLSHSGHRRLLNLREKGQEKAIGQHSPYWMEIKALDARGKPIKGLPRDGGYLKMVLPKVLFQGNPKTLSLGWIDFYR
jgi:type 1 glutamine amidotransferase